MTANIMTSCWYTALPGTGTKGATDTHMKLGISRGVPRSGVGAGFKLFKVLQPGTWFNSVGPDEYRKRYFDEVLDKLDPQTIVDQIREKAGDKIAVLVCYEKPDDSHYCETPQPTETVMIFTAGCLKPSARCRRLSFTASSFSASVILQAAENSGCSDFHKRMVRADTLNCSPISTSVQPLAADCRFTNDNGGAMHTAVGLLRWWPTLLAVDLLPRLAEAGD